MKKIIFTLIASVGFVANVYAADVLNPETTKELYQQAYKELVPISEELKSAVNTVLKDEWKQNKTIDKWVEDNQKSIELFKQATAGQSDGWLFAEKIEKFTYEMEIPQYQSEIRLLQLLLLQGRKYQVDGLYDQAKVNYLAAASFLVHFSEDKFAFIIPKMIEMVMFKYAYNSFVTSLDYDKNYLNELNSKLLQIKNNQDCMEQIIRNEYALMNSTPDQLIKELEKGTKLGMAIHNMFVMGENQNKSNSTFDRFSFNRRHNQEFIDELRLLFKKELKIREELLVAAFKNNNFEDYKKHSETYQNENDKILENLLVYGIKKLWSYKGRFHLVSADLSTRVMLSIAEPQYDKAGKKYWEYSNKLDELINKTNT